MSQLRNAPIPASCEHKASRLRGFRRSWGMRGQAQLLVKDAVFAKLGSPRVSDAVVPMVCGAGNADWPDYLLDYAPGPKAGAPARLIGTSWLGNGLPDMEHADLKTLELVNGHITASGVAYNGAGFNLTNWTATVAWAGRRQTTVRPLTIDYTSDQSRGSATGAALQPGTGGLKYAASTLAPAPADFVTFIKHRYRALNTPKAPCPEVVNVYHYSHLGFADGAEGSCGGVLAIWAKTGGHWRLLVGFNGDINCAGKGSKDPALLHRALQVLPVSCATHGGRKFVKLAHWPTSAE